MWGKDPAVIQGKSANYPFPKNIVLNIIKHYTLLITPILIFAKYGQWTGTYIVAFYSILARVTQSHTHTFTHLWSTLINIQTDIHTVDIHGVVFGVRCYLCELGI